MIPQLTFVLAMAAISCAYHQHGTSYALLTHHVQPKHHPMTYEYHHGPTYHYDHHYNNDIYEHKYVHDDHHHEKHYPSHHPKYEFKYGVKDYYTKDIHSQQEHRNGDKVVGEYMVHQPDGRIRIVQYTADKHNGFNAHVSYSGHALHPKQHYTHH